MPNHAEPPARDVEYRRCRLALSEERLVPRKREPRSGTELSLQALIVDCAHQPFGRFSVMPCPALRPCTWPETLLSTV